MASGKHIKNRIRSLESTRQITRAMEMVAASRLRQTQVQLAASRPYFEALSAAVRDMADSCRDPSPFLRAPECSRPLFVVIAGDRGLAGGYNSNILKRCAGEMVGKEAAVLPLGRKALEFFRPRGCPILTDAYAEAAAVSAEDCFTLGRTIADAFLAGRFDAVILGYTNFVSVLSQICETRILLPLVRRNSASSGDTIFEPDPEAVLSAIIPEYLGGMIYGALRESLCAEQGARRTAMDSATSNAGDMIDQLRLSHNQARQAAITRQITEIVAGSHSTQRS